MLRKILIVVEKKVDGLDFFIEEANIKIAKVSKKIDFLEKLDSKLDGLKSMSSSVEEKILDIAKATAELNSFPRHKSEQSSRRWLNILS